MLFTLMINIPCKFLGVAATGLLTCIVMAGCAHDQGGGKAGYSFMPGPVILNGVEYYPAKPGATYHNRPIEYTNQPPPADGLTFVKLISTNGIVIQLIDRKNSTNIVRIPDLM